MNDITFFAKTNFRDQEKIFGIKTDDRRRHMYIIGKTGMGKTNLLEHMAIQDIQNGHGVAFIDPHGDSAEKLIRSIPSNRINDVIYFNPADQDYPIALNVMEKVEPEYRHLVASGLVGVFKKIWADSWGPRLEYLLRNAILALLEYPGSTLLGVTRMLIDTNYRKRVMEKVTDPVVKSFWTEEFTKYHDRLMADAIAPIQNKVGQFISSSLIRNIVGQTKSSFDIRKTMDDRKILILNLSKGRIGEDNSALLGAMMITKIQLAAMARVDMPEEERKDFYLYVDEFQNFATESFANILSEARKYRLNLILANQYISQLDEKVRDSVFGNAGTIISFRVGAMDSEFLEKELAPIFTENDILNLPKYNVYLKLMIDGIAGDAFSATTLTPIKIEDVEGNAEKVIKVSRERYTANRAEVEEKISRWSGIIPATSEKIGVARTEPSSRDNEKSARENTSQIQNISSQTQDLRKLYDAVCDTCGTKIQIPFKPDGQRPTFCKDCFKDYQRTMARAKFVPRKETSRETITRRAAQQEKEEEETVEQKAYISQEKPITLNQIQYIAPKKFKSQRKRAQVDLEGVRKLISQNKNEK